MWNLDDLLWAYAEADKQAAYGYILATDRDAPEDECIDQAHRCFRNSWQILVERYKVA